MEGADPGGVDECRPKGVRLGGLVERPEGERSKKGVRIGSRIVSGLRLPIHVERTLLPHNNQVLLDVSRSPSLSRSVLSLG